MIARVSYTSPERRRPITTPNSATLLPLRALRVSVVKNVGSVTIRREMAVVAPASSRLVGLLASNQLSLSTTRKGLARWAIRRLAELSR
jgi:hypothetical protein